MLHCDAGRKPRGLPKGTGGLQLLFHARPALARAFFWSAGAVPVCFEADSESITIAFQRGELPDPIDGAATHSRPVVMLATRLSGDIFAMAVPNPIFRQQIIAIGKWLFAECGGISGSQLSMRFGDFTTARTFADSAAVPVLQDGSFSKTSVMPLFPAVVAASNNFSFIADRCGSELSAAKNQSSGRGQCRKL